MSCFSGLLIFLIYLLNPRKSSVSTLIGSTLSFSSFPDFHLLSGCFAGPGLNSTPERRTRGPFRVDSAAPGFQGTLSIP